MGLGYSSPYEEQKRQKYDLWTQSATVWHWFIFLLAFRCRYLFTEISNCLYKSFLYIKLIIKLPLTHFPDISATSQDTLTVGSRSVDSWWTLRLVWLQSVGSSDALCSSVGLNSAKPLLNWTLVQPPLFPFTVIDPSADSAAMTHLEVWCFHVTDVLQMRLT